MTIVGARIDNRLLHGIVATQWAPQSGATRVMVIDDEVANDPIIKESMKLARPSGMAISIITEEIAIKNFNAGKYDSQKLFVISKKPDIFLDLIKNSVEIRTLVLGGTVVPSRTDSKKVSKRAYVTLDQIDIYKNIASKGVKILVKFVPSDKDIELMNLI